jgi:acyl-CoA synthetase (NDP forming)
VGISQFVSLGNKCDLSGNDLLEEWEHDPATQVILFYMESLGNPVRFMEIARRVARRKPIVVVKAGRTDAGARAASSHTGSLAGLDVAVDALLGQAGVIRVGTIHELFEVARLLANQPPPAGNRVAIVTNAGGPGILASDACEGHGLSVTPLSKETQASLRAFLPAEASVANPVDMIASASAESYEKALRLVLAEPGIDAVVVLFVTPIVTDPAAVAAAIIRASQGSPQGKKPVLACLMGRQDVAIAVAALQAAKIPVYDFPESAAAALASAAGYGAWLQAPEGTLAVPAGFSHERARAVLEESGAGEEARWLRPEETSSLLEAAGLHTARAVEAQSESEAVQAAGALGYPVVVKLLSDTITHKSDVGGVVLGVRDAEGVRAAWRGITERLESLGRTAELRGVLVQQQVGRGIEAFIGATRDPEFGALVGFGIGGTAVEVWKDIAFRVAPLRDTDARAMLQQIRGRPLLEGFRGGPVADQRALVDALLRVSALVTAFPAITEIDLNPVMALADGAVVADARVRVQRTG